MSNYVGPSDELMENAQRLWGTKGVYCLIRGNENWVYALEGSNLIFRFTANYHRSLQELEAELEWIDFLFTNNCAVVMPVASRKNMFVHQLDDVWCVVVFEKAEGQPITEESHWNRQMAENWGASLAHMHHHTQNFVPQKSKRKAWNEDDGYVLAQKMIPVLGTSHFMSTHYLEAVTQLDKKIKTKSTFGLTHADLHHGNFFVDKNNQLKIFDFDDACYTWFMFDLAIPLAHIEMSVGLKRYSEQVLQFKNDILLGYSKIRDLPSDALEELQFFIRYRMAHLYLWGESRIQMQRTNDQKIIKDMQSFCENYLRTH